MEGIKEMLQTQNRKEMVIDITQRKREKKLKQSEVHWDRELRKKRFILSGGSTQENQGPDLPRWAWVPVGYLDKDIQGVQGESGFQQWGLGWEKKYGHHYPMCGDKLRGGNELTRGQNLWRKKEVTDWTLESIHT